ncbi:hypothetical protein [Escherichia coli]
MIDVLGPEKRRLEHYNEWHPHSALGYRSPREYLRQQASNGLSDNRCLEI